MKIVIFCGGRGSNEIIKSLLRINDLELSLVVNGYDDGLSTGIIRRIIPGMLGPSDFRKNASNILSCSSTTIELANFFEYRILESDLLGLDNEVSTEIILLGIFSRFINSINLKSYNSIKSYLSLFSKYFDNLQSSDLRNLLGMAMGNIVLAGTYLQSNKDFNQCISNLNSLLDSSARIYNATDGTNLVLVGLTIDGQILCSESEIVELKNNQIIKEIFLLDKYLTSEELSLISNLNINDKVIFLRSLQKFPNMNSQLISILHDADLVIFGPGTQHSSLYPTYMTQGLASKLQSISSSVKVLIGNISEDNDSKSENLKSLIHKIQYYLNLPSQDNFGIDEFITNIFLNTKSDDFIPWGYSELGLPSQIKVSFGQLSNKLGKHDGNRVVNGLFAVFKTQGDSLTISGYDRVAIVLPNLNEELTLNRVLEKLYYYDWLSYGILPEFIIIDGGSKDKSMLIAKRFPELKIIDLGKNLGRGAAIRQGINASDCKFIITFPTDDEYEPTAIKDVYLALKMNESSIVFGSRASLSVETNKRLKSIYEKNLYLYYLSKWGGNLITIILGIKFQRWLSDPLTSVKGFTQSSLSKITLQGNSVNWDTRVVKDASKQLTPIIEVPVTFIPRSRKQGKKITVFDGIRALFELIK